MARVVRDVPLRSGYVQALASWAPTIGLSGRLEAGLRPSENFAAYLAGSVDRLGPRADVGVKWIF